MPGILGPASPGVTPGRETVVTFDVETIDNMQEPPYWHELELSKISEGDKENPPRVTYLPEIGWQLTTYNSIVSYIHEGTEADSGILEINAPSGFNSLSLFRRPDDLLGVGGGAMKISGDTFYQKQVSAGDSWDDSTKYILSSDSASFPGPDPESDPISMDRIGKTDSNHLPTEKICLRFYVPGMEGQAKGALETIYFSGISGRLREDSASGTGRYALKHYGDGNAKLFELLADGYWKLRMTMPWTHKSKVVGSWHYVTIASDARFDGTTYVGSKIGFQFQSVSGLIEGAVGLAVAALGGPEWQFYKPRRISTVQNPVQAPVRLDCRRDIRAVLQISKAVHFATGDLLTVTFAMPFVPGSTTPLRFEWYGDIPSGTSIDVTMYRADAIGALTVADAGSSSTAAGHKSFTPVPGVAYYTAVITFNSNVDGFKTPTIRRIRLVRDRVLSVSTPGEFLAPKKDKISVTGPSSDPTHETASVIVHDRSGPTFPLFFRAGMSARVEIKHPADSTKDTIAFLGRVAQAVTSRRPRRTRTGFLQERLDPIQKWDWKTYRVLMMGEWMKAAELLTPQTYNFGSDPASLSEPKPYKVTDIIRILLTSRFPNSMVYVPDLSLRLFIDEKQSWLLEVYTEILPICMSLARDYLGGYLVFDANATNGGVPGNKYGCIRLMVPPRPPYKNLLEFVLKPNFEAGKQGMNVNSYIPTTDGLQEIKRCPVLYGSMREWVVPPECNYVYVQGATPVSGDTLAVGSEKLQAEAYNYVSAHFRDGQPIAADPNHPDYLGRMVPYILSDPGLTSEAAVRFACRRIYDMAAHAQKRITFDAPLVTVTDVNDPLQIRPRKLQFGDPVLFEGQQFIVDACNLDYEWRRGGDRAQYAHYDLFSVPALQNYNINVENLVQAGMGLFSMAA